MCVCVGISQSTRHFDLTSIWSRYFLDTLQTKYRQISTSFDILFWGDFKGQKIGVISTYMVWRNFDGQKIDVVSRNLFDVFSMSVKFAVLYIADSDKFEKDKKLWWFEDLFLINFPCIKIESRLDISFRQTRASIYFFKVTSFHREIS